MSQSSDGGAWFSQEVLLGDSTPFAHDGDDSQCENNADSEGGYNSVVASQQSRISIASAADGDAAPASQGAPASPSGWVSPDLEAVVPEDARPQRGRPRRPVVQDEMQLQVANALPAAPASALDLPTFDRHSIRHLSQEGALEAWGVDDKQIVGYLVDSLSKDAPDVFPSSSSGLAQQYVFSHRLESSRPLRSSSWIAEASAAGMDTVISPGVAKTYKARFIESASLLYLSSRVLYCSMARKVAQMIGQGKVTGIMLMFAGQSDEASSRLRVAYGSGQVQRCADPSSSSLAVQTESSRKRKETAPETAKIVQSELRVGMLLYHRSSKEYQFVTGLLPCTLDAVDRTTSEALHAVHKATYTLPGFGQHFMSLFRRNYVCHTQEKCSANEKQVNTARHEDKLPGQTPVSRLSLACDVHRAATIATRAFDLTKDDVSGLIAFAITERGSGRLSSLREIVGELCVRRLRIVRGGRFGGPGDEAYEHRKAVANLTLPVKNPVRGGGTMFRAGIISAYKQRSSWESFFNGDIRDKEFVYHYVDEGGPSDASIRERFREEAPTILLPRLMDVFPRHRWTCAHDVVRAALLLAATHDLLAQALPIWAKSLGADVAMTAQLPASADPGGGGDADAEQGYCSDVEGSGPNAEDQPLVVDGSLMLSKEQWPDYFKRMKVTAGTWARTKPIITLTIMAVAGQPLDTMMTHGLFMAGEQWEKLNDGTTLLSNERHYRLAVAHEAGPERACSAHVLRLLCSPSPWVALSSQNQTLSARSLAFRFLSRVSAGCFLYLAIPHSGFPFRLFKLLTTDPPCIDDILGVPECMRDDFSHDFITDFGDSLGGPESMAVLASVGDSVRCDTSRIETGHSFWQREARLKGTQVLADTHASVSATFVQHRQRCIEARFRRWAQGHAKRARGFISYDICNT